MVVFDGFFDMGLKFPTAPLLEGVLHHFYVELPQLSANGITRLAIFEWAMWVEGCEGWAKLFASTHEASYQSKPQTEGVETKALYFGSVNF